MGIDRYRWAVPRFELDAWLADRDQPAARFRYLVDMQGLSPDSGEARAALRDVPRRGWAAEILREQKPRGFWVSRKTLYRPKYRATNWMLLVLAELGLTVQHPKVRRAVDLMLADYGGSDGPFNRQGGEPHFCFVGNTARMMILFGLGDDRRVRASLDWLADRQLDDGGWDCFGRPNGTLDCWEALAAYAAIGRRRWTQNGNGPSNAGPSSTSSADSSVKVAADTHRGRGCILQTTIITTSSSASRRSSASATAMTRARSPRGIS